MARYVKVYKDDADESPWRWECAICWMQNSYRQHHHALALADEHARTCGGVVAAMERDLLRAELGHLPC